MKCPACDAVAQLIAFEPKLLLDGVIEVIDTGPVYQCPNGHTFGFTTLKTIMPDIKQGS